MEDTVIPEAKHSIGFTVRPESVTSIKPLMGQLSPLDQVQCVSTSARGNAKCRDLPADVTNLTGHGEYHDNSIDATNYRESP